MDTIAVSASRSRPTPARSRARRERDSDFAFAFAATRYARAMPARSPQLLVKMILPTRQNVQQLASELGARLSARFAAAGFAETPAVGLSIDRAGDIRVSGARDDLGAIAREVTADEGLQRLIRATDAIAAHAYAMENGGRLRPHCAYRLSSDPQEIVAQYANVHVDRPTATSITYGNGTVSVAADGAAWARGQGVGTGPQMPRMAPDQPDPVSALGPLSRE